MDTLQEISRWTLDALLEQMVKLKFLLSNETSSVISDGEAIDLAIPICDSILAVMRDELVRRR